MKKFKIDENNIFVFIEQTLSGLDKREIDLDEIVSLDVPDVVFDKIKMKFLIYNVFINQSLIFNCFFYY